MILCLVAYGALQLVTQRFHAVCAVVTAHQLLSFILYISIAYGCLLLRELRYAASVVAFTSVNLVIAGIRWSMEVFDPTRWWTLTDIAENLLLCGTWLGIYLLHRRLTNAMNYQTFVQTVMAWWTMLQSNSLRQRDIIHTKLSWATSGALWYPVALWRSRSTKDVIVGGVAHNIDRGSILKLVTALLWLTPAAVLLNHGLASVLPPADIIFLVFIGSRARSRDLVPLTIMACGVQSPQGMMLFYGAAACRSRPLVILHLSLAICYYLMLCS